MYLEHMAKICHRLDWPLWKFWHYASSSQLVLWVQQTASVKDHITNLQT